MYSFDSRIRYSEIGQDGKLKLGALVDYFQDCVMFQSEASGIGVQYLKEHKEGWVIIYWQIDIIERPYLGEKVTVSTWPYEFKGFWGKRNFLMTAEDGRKLAYANSLWSYMDMEAQRPKRVTQDQLDGFPIQEKLDMEYTSRKIEIDGEGVKRKEIEITSPQLDTNHHMNNAQYVKIAEEYIPDSADVSRIRVEYKRQVVHHDTLTPIAYTKPGRYMIELCNKGERAAVVEFIQ